MFILLHAIHWLTPAWHGKKTEIRCFSYSIEWCQWNELQLADAFPSPPFKNPPGFLRISIPSFYLPLVFSSPFLRRQQSWGMKLQMILDFLYILWHCPLVHPPPVVCPKYTPCTCYVLCKWTLRCGANTNTVMCTFPIFSPFLFIY